MNNNASGSARFASIERAVVRTLVLELLDSAAALPTADVFIAVCDVMLNHFSLTNARLSTRIAGKTRAFVWSGPASSAGLPATEVGNVLLEGDPQLPMARGSAGATVSDEQLGLSARLDIESGRPLDGGDHALLEDVLRRMLCLPAAPSAGEMSLHGELLDENRTMND